MKVVLMGAPGAGKGTQAARISAALGIPAISTGDMIRSAVQQNTALGLELKEIIESGRLAPDDVICRLVAERLNQGDCAGGCLLDGFPRTIEQAKYLDSVTTVDAVINLDVADEDIEIRMSGRRFCPNCQRTYHVKYQKPAKEGICDACGAALSIRVDDKPETVRARLRVYHEQTEPVLNYYGERVITVDGNQNPDHVEQDILKALQA